MLEEFIGYAASILVAVSLMMSSILKLRIINLVGAITFVVYGLMLPAYPVAFVNFLIVCINVYYLVQVLFAKEYFYILNTTYTEQYTQHFLNFHSEDIQKFYPQLSLDKEKDYLSFFVLRNTVPAGLILLEEHQDRLHVILDYVVPQYRDFKIGHFFYNKNCFTKELITSSCQGDWHQIYLEKMGFNKEDDLYVLHLNSGD
ncbi:hypothetical protein [Candidatus Uabimicrobium amorphum]|uniref:Membrane protein n=1 Tax=Uabimicrobium amorphum TaxID=2596890 RepID=A0A5S9IJ27_UABAM|nr:hypothetical protein [Candidatus Uabimicrobium amorphum]BBM82634.1 membrane protein [Candidatus Uabimicrobium amorphum]